MTDKRLHMVATLIIVGGVAFIVALALAWVLPTPWSFICAGISAFLIGWFGSSILVRVHNVGRVSDTDDGERKHEHRGY